MTTFDNDSLGKLGKISEEFCCKNCDYTTSLKYNFKIHLKSIKHKNNETTTNNNELLGKISKKYECENCEKGFNDRAGLWRHNKKCKIEEKIEKLRCSEIKALLFDEYLRVTNNEKTGAQSITNFFGKK